MFKAASRLKFFNLMEANVNLDKSCSGNFLETGNSYLATNRVSLICFYSANSSAYQSFWNANSNKEKHTLKACRFCSKCKQMFLKLT